MLESLCNTVKCFQAVMVATLLNGDPRTGVSEPAVRKSPAKQLFLNNSQNSRGKHLCRSLFLNKV